MGFFLAETTFKGQSRSSAMLSSTDCIMTSC